MKLSWSVGARSRPWSKALRRIRPRFETLVSAFAAVELKCPIHESLLVCISDDHGNEYIKEIPNNDGVFQVMVGFDSSLVVDPSNDWALESELFHQLSRAILACPFASPDREAVKLALERWKAVNLIERR